jgi:hypothetical protein
MIHFDDGSNYWLLLIGIAHHIQHRIMQKQVSVFGTLNCYKDLIRGLTSPFFLVLLLLLLLLVVVVVLWGFSV